jgi:hypothetical protein
MRIGELEDKLDDEERAAFHSSFRIRRSALGVERWREFKDAVRRV